MEQPRNKFCREVKKALIDRDMTVTRLAEELGMNREHLSSVINGSRNSKKVEKAVADYLGLSA